LKFFSGNFSLSYSWHSVSTLSVNLKHYLISYNGQKWKVSDRLFLKILTKTRVIPTLRHEIYAHVLWETCWSTTHMHV